MYEEQPSPVKTPSEKQHSHSDTPNEKQSAHVDSLSEVQQFYSSSLESQRILSAQGDCISEDSHQIRQLEKYKVSEQARLVAEEKLEISTSECNQLRTRLEAYDQGPLQIV
jgi:hypothetical protein